MPEYNTVLATLTAVMHDRKAAQKLTETEMVLMLLEQYAPHADQFKAYLLLCDYSVVGRIADLCAVVVLQKAHKRLLKCSSKKY